MIHSFPFRFRQQLLILFVLLVGSITAAAQPSFSFRLGAASVLLDDNAYNGLSVGSVAKFDVIPYLRFRMQLDVDKIRMEGVTTPYLTGDQSVTFICTGIGVETAIGGPDAFVFANITPHGTLRTTLHQVINEAGEPAISDVARFSLGLATGVGGEIFINDRLGLEGLVQYDIYNVDSYADETIYRGIRATLGLQFYVGMNYKR